MSAMESKDVDATQVSKIPSDIDSIDSTDKSSDPQPMLEPAEISSAQSLKEDNVVSSTVDEDNVDGKRLPADDCSAQDLEKDNLTQSADKLTSSLAIWLINNEVDNRVIDLIYWKDIKKTAIVFGILLLILLFLAYHTLLSVISFFALSFLTVSALYRIGMTVISALQKTDSRTSYESFIEKNMTISPEKARGIGEAIGNKMNTVLMKVSKLFLVEDTMASIKFGIFLWFLSCVGKWFDTITLFMIGTVVLFSLPRLYEDNQKQVDEIMRKVSQKLHQCFIMVKTKLESRFYQKEKTT